MPEVPQLNSPDFVPRNSFSPKINKMIFGNILPEEKELLNSNGLFVDILKSDIDDKSKKLKL